MSSVPSLRVNEFGCPCRQRLEQFGRNGTHQFWRAVLGGRIAARLDGGQQDGQQTSSSRNQVFYLLHWTHDADAFGVTVHRDETPAPNNGGVLIGP